MRIATFNLENLDDELSGSSWEADWPERVAVIRPMLERLRADVLCLQEVHAQDDPALTPPDGRRLRALADLLSGTRYARHQLAHTHLKGRAEPEKLRNLVTLIPPGWRFVSVREVMNEDRRLPFYRYITSDEAEQDVDGDGAPDPEGRYIRWERPLLHCEVETATGLRLHVLNAHFKSKHPTNIPGQKRSTYVWRSAAGWAEGFFVSSMKRVGAALGARLLIDELLQADPGARVILCGDLNAESHEVPIQALRGRVEDHGDPDLNHMELFPCEDSVPEDKRFTLYHHGRRNMLDHLLVSRSLLGAYRGVEIHNELVRDESVKYANDAKFPQPDHAPVVAEFDDAALAGGVG